MDFNPYKVLAVDPSADPDVIAAAYRTLSKKFHPDINKTPEAQAKMREINRAYDMLKDPESRKKVDADLNRQQTSSRSGGSTTTGYTPPRPGPSQANRGRSTGPDWSGVADSLENLRRRAASSFTNIRDDFKPATPADKTLYFYQKRLEDEATGKRIKVSVFHDGATNRKICNIQASAPNGRGQVTSGEVFLDSEKMFDLTLAMSEATRMINEPTTPIEMNADHDVYFRQAVPGLGKTYMGVEVIKRTRGAGKEALLLLGEKNARTEKDGVVSPQTPTQLQQLGRIFQSALEAMR